jgi:SAM-dependent methyltransferase
MSTMIDMATLPLAPAPASVAIDLAAVKQRQQATWATGDYHLIGTQIVIVAEQLIETLDLCALERVLDVATGSGNAALAAARRATSVVGIDYVPSLLDRARLRAAAESLRAEFLQGDAEALPFEDGTFDVVTSVFGAMFAPDQWRTAGELARVTRPGGRIGLVAHTPEGFIGQLFRTIGRHVPPPAGVASPSLWGTQDRLDELFETTASGIRSQKRHYVFRAESPVAWVASWRRSYGPVAMAFDALDEDGREALEGDLLDLVARFNRAEDGTMAAPSEYLESVVTRR